MRFHRLALTIALATVAFAPSAVAQGPGVVPDAGLRVSAGPAGDECRQVRLAADAGVPWVSVGESWEGLEPSRGTYVDPAGTRRLLQCAKDLGLNTQLIITNAPEWASGRTGGDDPPTAANIPAYGAFLSQLATGLAPLVDVWTPWNEPNFDLFWRKPHDPVHYVAIQQAAYAAIKPVDPMSLVSSAPLVGTPTSSGTNAWDYLTAAYAAGLKGNADLVLLNFYPRTEPEGTATDSAGRPAPWALSSQPYMRKLVDARDPGRPIWITETSYATCDNCYGGAANHVTEAQQADYITRMYTYRRRYLQGVTDRIFWYETRDSGTDIRDWWGMQGIYRNDGSPKPAVAALQALRVVGLSAAGAGVQGTTTPVATTPPAAAPELPAEAASQPAPANGRTVAGIRVGLSRLRVTVSRGTVTAQVMANVSSGRARLRFEGYRSGRWRLVRSVPLSGSSGVRVRFADLGYLGVRVLLRPESDRAWLASRVARMPRRVTGTSVAPSPR